MYKDRIRTKISSSNSKRKRGAAAMDREKEKNICMRKISSMLFVVFLTCEISVRKENKNVFFLLDIIALPIIDIHRHTKANGIGLNESSLSYFTIFVCISHMMSEEEYLILLTG